MANEILFPKGDDATISTEINDATGADLPLTGATVILYVYDTSSNLVFSKTGNITSEPLGTVEFAIVSADTSGQDGGLFHYKIKVTDNSGNISTVRTAPFYILSTQMEIDLSTIRTMLSDTDSTSYILTDAQLYYYIATNDNINTAASKAARAIHAYYAKLAVDTTVEGVSVKYSTRAIEYKRLAETLEVSAASEDVPMPVVTGISKDEITTQRNDSDRVQEKFYMDKFSNPPNSTDLYYGED